MGQTVSCNLELSWKEGGEAQAGDVIPEVCEGMSLIASSDRLFCFGGGAYTPQGEFVQYNTLYSTAFTSPLEWHRVASQQGSAPVARSGAASCCIDDKLWIFGGLNADAGWLRDLHMFDTKSSQWTAVPAQERTPSVRDKCAMVAAGNNLLLFGGFGPVVDEDSSGDEADADGGGGEELGPAKFRWFNDLYIYNITSASWRRVLVSGGVSAPPERAAHALAVAAGYLWVFGGKTSSAGRTSDLWRISVAAMMQNNADDNGAAAWEQVQVKGTAPGGRSFHSLTAVGPSRLVCYGGLSDQGKHYSDLHIFDCQQLAWVRPKAYNNPPQPRGFHGAAVHDNTLYVWGGSAEYDANTGGPALYLNDMNVLPLGKINEEEITITEAQQNQQQQQPQ